MIYVLLFNTYCNTATLTLNVKTLQIWHFCSKQ